MVALRCVLLLTSFVIFTAAASAAGQAAAVGEADLKLTRLPSDPALAVYVGLRGTWTHGIFTHEFAEIEAAVAAFQPGEQVSDEFEPWCKRQINDPQPPPGWRFFSVKESRNMRLHVEICDTRQRLGSVLIHDRDTGSVIGRLHADRRGSRISGTILIEPTDRHFTLDVKAKDTGATLCRMGADSPETDDVIICTLIYGFNCNQGLEHACPIVGPDGTWGDPASLADKVSTPSPDCQICIGGYHYMHDAGYAGQKAPRYPLMNKLLLRDVHWDPSGFSSTAIRVVHGEVLRSLREAYNGGETIMPSWVPPPFSEGTPHWRVDFRAAIHSVICYPYRGRPMYKDQIIEELQARMEASRDAGVGSTTPSVEVAASMNRSLSLTEKARWRVSEAIPVGDLWGYRAKLAEPPFAEPLSGLTKPVTFRLIADKTPPDDKPGLIGGTAKLTVERAWTDPPPPPALTNSHTLVFPSEGQNKGVCTVNLPKGYAYQVTPFTTHLSYYTFANGVEFGVPGNAEITLRTRLAAVTFVVQSATQRQPVSATVQIKAADGRVLLQAETAPDSAGNYTYTWGPVTPGIYSFRAKPVGGPDSTYGDWESFQLPASTIPMVVPLHIRDK